jgi:hypothetical protein
MKMKELLSVNHFESWIFEKMYREWSSEIESLDKSDFERYGCNPNECMVLGELKKWVKVCPLVDHHPWI